jgi:hypothetical protein
MHFPPVKKLTVTVLVMAAPSLLFADYTYQQTTQITGGSIMSMMKMAGAFSSQARKAGQPIVSTIYLKGNQLANVSQDSIEIIDLDKETITQIDTTKHTYTIVTFQQMKDQMAKAAQQLAKQPTPQPAAAPAPDPNANNVQMTFNVNVRNTGVQKEISGLTSSEAILTMVMNATDQNTQQSGAMTVTNDMWLVSAVPGYTQVTDFYARMGAKMGTVDMGIGLDVSKALSQNPGAGQALVDMGKEMQKLKGVPIMQIMRMGMTTNGQPLPAASEAPLPASATPATPSGSDVAKQGAMSALTSHFGLGGFGKKKQPDPPPANPDASATPPTSTVLMESQTTVSSFSSDPVDPSHFDVPSGYKQVQSPMAQ